MRESLLTSIHLLDEGKPLHSLISQKRLKKTQFPGIWEIKPVVGRAVERVFVGIGPGGFRIISGSSDTKGGQTGQAGTRQMGNAARQWATYQFERGVGGPS